MALTVQYSIFTVQLTRKHGENHLTHLANFLASATPSCLFAVTTVFVDQAVLSLGATET